MLNSIQIEMLSYLKEHPRISYADFLNGLSSGTVSERDKLLNFMVEGCYIKQHGINQKDSSFSVTSAGEFCLITYLEEQQKKRDEEQRRKDEKEADRLANEKFQHDCIKLQSKLSMRTSLIGAATGAAVAFILSVVVEPFIAFLISKLCG